MMVDTSPPSNDIVYVYREMYLRCENKLYEKMITPGEKFEVLGVEYVLGSTRL